MADFVQADNWVQTGSNIYNRNSGGVKIGSTAPTEARLEIQGNDGELLKVGNLTNDWGANTAIGVQSGNGLLVSKINLTNDANRVAIIFRDTNAGGQLHLFNNVGTAAAKTVQINASGNSYLLGGNVGVGTSGPESILHIQQSNPSGITTLFIDNNAASRLDNAASIRFAVDTGASVTNGGAEIKVSNVDAGNGAADMRFTTYTGDANREHLRITSGGRVGIGIGSPVTNLEVLESGLNVTAGIKITNTNNAGSLSHARLTLQVGGANSGDPYVLFSNPTEAASSWSVGVDNSSSNRFKITAEDVVGTGSDRVTITYPGNVGIATGSPIGKLHVIQTSETNASTGFIVGRNTNDSELQVGYRSGTEVWEIAATYGTTGGYRPITFWTAATERMRIGSEGNVGIGISNPTSRLHVSGGDTNLNDSVTSLRIGGTVALGRGTDGDSIRVNGGTASGIDFTPANDNSIKVKILSNGNVGIGTTTPSALLEVSGGDLAIQSDRKLYLDEASNSYMTYNSGTASVELYVGGALKQAWT